MGTWKIFESLPFLTTQVVISCLVFSLGSDFFALSDVEYEGPEYLPVSQAWIKLRFNVTCTKMNCDVPHNQENLRFVLTASTGDADEELFDTDDMGDMVVIPSTSVSFRSQGFIR